MRVTPPRELPRIKSGGRCPPSPSGGGWMPNILTPFAFLSSRPVRRRRRLRARSKTATTALLTEPGRGAISRGLCTWCSAASAGNSWQKPMAQTLAAPKGSEVPAHGESEAHPKVGFWALTLGSLGVVYGDIGTSPLYAFREAVLAASPNELPSRAAVLGVLSLILWALIVIVDRKSTRLNSSHIPL